MRHNFTGRKIGEPLLEQPYVQQLFLFLLIHQLQSLLFPPELSNSAVDSPGGVFAFLDLTFDGV